MSDTSSKIDSSLPWWKQLSGYHWFVFIVASLAWLFDCLDQQLFILARGSAIKSLMAPGTDGTVLNEYGTYATAIFVAGWATGGLIFGSVGDKIGRAKTLTITVLMYSVFTGLSALSKGWLDFAIYRFVTGLGVGGVFGLAVALVADALPDNARAGALGTLQALSAVGNVTAGLISMWVGNLVAAGTMSVDFSWKFMFLLGAAPAFLCVFIQMRLKEPEKWVQARKTSGKKMGSYSNLLGNPRWRGRAIAGLLLSVAGVIGLWGIGFFSPELVGPVIEESLRSQGLDEAAVAGAKAKYIGINSIVQNVGAFIGMLLMTKLAQMIGRKSAFIVAFIAALLATVGFFQFFNGVSDIWMSGVMGACQLAIFAGFAIYLPELFPTSLRSTGTSFCYNVGRFVAAGGILATAPIKTWAAKGANTPIEKIDAFRDATSYMSLIFLIGLIALLFLPETKGRALPED